MFHSGCLVFVILLNNENRQQTLQIGGPELLSSRSCLVSGLEIEKVRKLKKLAMRQCGNSVMRLRQTSAKLTAELAESIKMLSAFEGFLSDNRKIGIILTIIGGVLLVMGVLLVFDPVLLAMGNFLFIG